MRDQRRNRLSPQALDGLDVVVRGEVLGRCDDLVLEQTPSGWRFSQVVIADPASPTCRGTLRLNRNFDLRSREGRIDAPGDIHALRSEVFAPKLREGLPLANQSLRHLFRFSVRTSSNPSANICVASLDTDWFLRGLIIDTRPWLPGGKVLLPAESIAAIDWRREEIRGQPRPKRGSAKAERQHGIAL